MKKVTKVNVDGILHDIYSNDNHKETEEVRISLSKRISVEVEVRDNIVSGLSTRIDNISKKVDSIITWYEKD